ncbi:MAG: 4Fe-4S dicluster domain-containing protein [Synergistaceae bacterium]|jgi:2-oxoglutarate ferredoxin oxidoreductase subunit delta|nr:4Fe-4S dicluster domain-containing protein [Synergistaceae bacterium]
MAKKFHVSVNSAWCKGCGLCVGVCPKSVLALNERLKSEPARMDDCIGCRQCENICPDLAITVKEEGENDG